MQNPRLASKVQRRLQGGTTHCLARPTHCLARPSGWYDPEQRDGRGFISAVGIIAYVHSKKGLDELTALPWLPEIRFNPEAGPQAMQAWDESKKIALHRFTYRYVATYSFCRCVLQMRSSSKHRFRKLRVCSDLRWLKRQ